MGNQPPQLAVPGAFCEVGDFLLYAHRLTTQNGMIALPRQREVLRRHEDAPVL